MTSALIKQKRVLQGSFVVDRVLSCQSPHLTFSSSRALLSNLTAPNVFDIPCHSLIDSATHWPPILCALFRASIRSLFGLRVKSRRVKHTIPSSYACPASTFTTANAHRLRFTHSRRSSIHAPYSTRRLRLTIISRAPQTCRSKIAQRNGNRFTRRYSMHLLAMHTSARVQL